MGVVAVSGLAVLLAAVCGGPAYAWAQLATDSCGVQCPAEDAIRLHFGAAGAVLVSMLLVVLLGAAAPRLFGESEIDPPCRFCVIRESTLPSNVRQVSIVACLLLVVLPWSEFWERNYFALGWPVIQAIVTNNFVRGGISGLGIVNLIVGVTDLSHVFAARSGPDLPLDLDNHPVQN